MVFNLIVHLSFDIGSSTEDDEGGAVADAGGGRWPPTGLRVRLATDAERQLHERYLPGW